MSNRILAVVVSYQCSYEVLMGNISLYEQYVDKIIVWENTPSKKIEEYPEDNSKIIYMSKGRNVGIAYALNYALDYAIVHEYDFLLTMDQDTVWHDFIRFKHTVMEASQRDMALWGPCGFQCSQDREPFVKTNFLITSGMMASAKLLRKLKGWPRDYHVDGIDNDLCCRAIEKEVPLYSVSSGWIEQTCGIPETKCFLGKTFIVHNYPPERLYEIYRNHLITFRKYKKSKELKRSWIREWYKYRLFYVLLEDDKLKKILAIFRGTIDGLCYRGND